MRRTEGRGALLCPLVLSLALLQASLAWAGPTTDSSPMAPPNVDNSSSGGVTVPTASSGPAAPNASVEPAPEAPAPPPVKKRKKKGSKEKKAAEPPPPAAPPELPKGAEAQPAGTPYVDPLKDAGREVIHKIEIRGNSKIDREAVLEKVKSTVGSVVSDATVREDIVAIHKLGYFDSIQADFENGDLIFTVKERPSIYKIVFAGNEQISTDDLKGTLSVKTYDIYDENLVRESVRKITKFYEDKGFYLAKVDFTVRPSSHEKDMVEVVFRVREYDKVRIKKITFLGNKAFDDDTLKKTLRGTAENSFFSWISGSGNFKELDFKNDLQMLQYWYLNEGYVKFRHDPPIVTVSEDKKWVYITIKVDEGKQYKMGTIDFGGDLLFPKDELEKKLTLKVGDVFSISKRNADIVALTEKYQDLGYANVNTVPDISFDDEKLLVNTTYNFEKGTLVHFGRITVKGNTKTRDKVIRRELRIQEGELYSGSGMRLSKENVERLGFFDNDSVQFQTKSPPGRPDLMDVDVSVKERPTGQFQLGAGYATTTKLFFTTQVSETNFMGKGQELRLAGQLAADKLNRSLTLSFTDPYAWDSLWSVGGTLSYELIDIPNNFSELRKGFQLNVGHPIGEYTRIYFGYRLEDVEYLQTVDNLIDPYITAHQDFENGTISSGSVTVAEDMRNNRMETTSGHYWRVNEEAAGIGGNRRFLRSIAEGRFYRKIWGDLTFRTKLELGGIWDYGGNGIQRAEKFLLGGTNNLRGYEYASIGQDSPNIDPNNGQPYNAGGNDEIVFMTELEYPVAKEVGLKLVVFYDAGDAFDRIQELAMKQDIGWGFRWFSPLGPLRFEWGYPLKKIGRSNGSQFNFMIGPPF